jgi:phosphotransferase system  glucose/maltose/N-acetylglucosamine-specific IIC component
VTRPLPKWLSIVLTVLWMPAMLGIGILMQADLFWKVVGWCCLVVGGIVVLALVCGCHWFIYKWLRNEDQEVVPKVEVSSL